MLLQHIVQVPGFTQQQPPSNHCSYNIIAFWPFPADEPTWSVPDGSGSALRSRALSSVTACCISVQLTGSRNSQMGLQLLPPLESFTVCVALVKRYQWSLGTFRKIDVGAQKNENWETEFSNLQKKFTQGVKKGKWRGRKTAKRNQKMKFPADPSYCIPAILKK